MGLRGDLGSIRGLKQRIQSFPRTLAVGVASRAAPAMTGLARDAYSSGRSVYGEARPTGARGQALTLRKTGAVAGQLRFTAIGTIVRCVLGPSYAKYLIGKYGILPNGALPAGWSKRLAELVRSTSAP